MTVLKQAYELLLYQKQSNPVYQQYCENFQAFNPNSKIPWEAFPPLPITAFKEHQIRHFDEKVIQATFHSSGTTSSTRSTHQYRTLTQLNTSILKAFAAMTTNQLTSPQMAYFSLMPPFEKNTDSSLAYMLSLIIKTYGTKHSDFLTSESNTFCLEKLLKALHLAQKEDIPIHIMGPSFAYVHLLDELNEKHFKLHPLSRIMETGGYKAKSREVPKNELRQLLSNTFGININQIYAEYSMCELSSQCYEIQNTMIDNPPENLRGKFIAPPWLIPLTLSPTTLQPVYNEAAQIAFIDLANQDSIAYILTQDIGIATQLSEKDSKRLPFHPKTAFSFLSRAANAQPKGCSLTWEQLNNQ